MPCTVLPFARVPRPAGPRERAMSMPLAPSKLPLIGAVVICECAPAVLWRPTQSEHGKAAPNTAPVDHQQCASGTEGGQNMNDRKCHSGTTTVVVARKPPACVR